VILPVENWQLDEARAILCEYAEWVGDAICFAAFETELANLPGRYAPLLLAWEDRQIAACAALREFAPGIGEMKRLYVRPQYRGQGLGRALTERIIDESRAAGHQLLRLDTLPKMQAAIPLYRALGFREIPRYGDNPEAAICFELTL
jgi:GNAT superfamily N-acetyltransferase